MLKIAVGINSGLRLLLEIASVFLLIWAGFAKWKLPFNILFGALMPVVIIFVWGIFIDPNSQNRVGRNIRIILEILIFISVSVVIAFSFSWKEGLIYFGISVVNSLINYFGELV